MTSFGVTLLSGGLDSTTVTAYAKTKVENLTAITFRYGQIHSKEVDCSKEIACKMGISHRILDASFMKDVGWYSALTNPEQFHIPMACTVEKIGNSIPITYVPLRNTLFLSLAAAYLESEVLYAIEKDGLSIRDVKAYIFMAPNAIDYSGYPDCRPEFFEKMSQVLMLGSKLWTQYDVPMKIETPVITMSKAQIVQMAIKLEACLEQTWSCYKGGKTPCGTCDSCLLRAKGFQEAGYQDPLLIRLGRS